LELECKPFSRGIAPSSSPASANKIDINNSLACRMRKYVGWAFIFLGWGVSVGYIDCAILLTEEVQL
jgi:hypothetical protein